MRASVPMKATLISAVVLIPGLLLAGCSHKDNDDNNQAAGNTAAAASTAGASTGATTGAASTSTGEVAPSAAISSWNDNNIVSKLAESDKGEVELAKLAEKKASIPAVKNYAKMLVADHSKGEGEVRSLESKAKLPAKPASDDTTSKSNQDLMKQFSSMTRGKDWDSTWVKHEYDDHQQDIADTKAMQNQAKDAQLKQLLGNELPVLQKHLDAAQKLLGTNPGGSSAWHNEELHKTDSTKSGR